MIDALNLGFAGATGIFLGGIFFGGLWWTVRKGVRSQQPGLWILGSLLLRTSIVLIGFYSIAGNHWERLLVCLVGFLVARQSVLWLTQGAKAAPSLTSVGHRAP